MKVLRRVAALATGLTLCLSASTASAFIAATSPLSVTAENAWVVPGPGAQAMPGVSFAFDAPYAFTNLTLQVDYDGSLMTFNPGQSVLSVGGVQAPFHGVLNILSLDPDFSYDASHGSGSYSLSALYGTGSYPVPAGTVMMKAVFDLDASFAAGTSTDVTVSGFMTSTAADIDPFLPDEFSVIATVTAVPEPESWLMLLGGLGMLAMLRRRRMTMQATPS